MVSTILTASFVRAISRNKNVLSFNLGPITDKVLKKNTSPSPKTYCLPSRPGLRSQWFQALSHSQDDSAGSSAYCSSPWSLLSLESSILASNSFCAFGKLFNTSNFGSTFKGIRWFKIV